MPKLAVVVVLFLMVTWCALPCSGDSALIYLDNTVGLGRLFDGIGGLSGGSVSMVELFELSLLFVAWLLPGVPATCL